jgi:very-short-patch-repair endonuclease
MLWAALRGNRLAGLKFRRQHPMDRFVLDFYCPEKRLAVEIDGEIHQAQNAADEERQKALESMGIRFVRLPARLVEDNISVALERIRSATVSDPSPHPTGEGSREARG